MDTMCFTVQGKNGEKPLELNYERVFAIGYAVGEAGGKF